MTRQGRAGLGLYISQEEQVLNPADEVVARRHSTIALFPETRLGGTEARA